MGLDSNGVKFLLYAKRLGVDFGSTATIGRQTILTTSDDMRRQFEHAGYPFHKAEKINRLTREYNGYSEWLFELLGAVSADSFDISSYEGATQTHDFNVPIPEHFRHLYSVVLDGGALEHVFNYPVALKSCMEMVRKGGHFLGITPTNNFSGHGFYQFSPELFFRAFSNENGFEIVDLIFFEDRINAPWYRLKDPATIGRRLTFENIRPAYLLIIARRTSNKPVFEQFPQQSDYVAAWKNPDERIGGNVGHRNVLFRLPGALTRRFRKFIRPRSGRFDPEGFGQFDPFEKPASVMPSR